MCMILRLIRNAIYKSYLLNIYEYLMIKNNIYSDFLKTVFIGLLSFSEYLANKFMSLNNEQCKTGTPHIDLNPVQLNYYQFMVSLTLKRLGVNLTLPPHPYGFSKNVSSKERVKLWFFVTFDIIISHIFPENFIEIPQLV